MNLCYCIFSYSASKGRVYCLLGVSGYGKLIAAKLLTMFACDYILFKFYFCFVRVLTLVCTFRQTGTLLLGAGRVNGDYMIGILLPLSHNIRPCWDFSNFKEALINNYKCTKYLFNFHIYTWINLNEPIKLK